MKEKLNELKEYIRNQLAKMTKIKIKNSGTKEFPFYQLLINKNEICSTNSPNKAKYLAKIISSNLFISKSADIIKFGAYLTGHDEETIKQLLNDYQRHLR